MKSPLIFSTVVLVVCQHACDLRGQSVANVQGKELSAAIRLPEEKVAVDGVLFLPEKVAQVHRLLVFIDWGLGRALFEDEKWRELAVQIQSGLLLVKVRNDGPRPPRRPTVAERASRNSAVGGGKGVLLLLERLAQQSKHSELTKARMLLWGHSGAGSFAMTFAVQFPQRTVGFVRYHSHLRQLPIDLELAAQIPGLIVAGQHDEVAGVEDSRALWQKGRLLAAPWTFVIEPEVGHSSRDGLKQTDKVVIPWVAAVFRLRMPREKGELCLVNEPCGYLADFDTGEVKPFTSLFGATNRANWLPDKETGLGWQHVTGLRR